MKSSPIISWFFVLAATMFPGTLGAQSTASATAQKKLDHIEANARLPHPDRTPTVFTEQEINSYLASGNVELPAGIKSARFRGQPGVVTALLRVDFDELKAGHSSANPLLAIFTGVHDVEAQAHAHGTSGEGFVQVDSVSLDGVEIPKFVLQLFVDKYLKPKYPEIGLDSRFRLPDRIDTAVVGNQTLTVTQK